MKKKILFLFMILIVCLFLGVNTVYAVDEVDDNINDIFEQMKDTSDPTKVGGEKIKNTINNVIGLIQVTGTGISVIAVTMLGIKYLLASPSDKADVKKQIMPILIGCILLFGAVNLVAIVADFSAILT